MTHAGRGGWTDKAMQQAALWWWLPRRALRLSWTTLLILWCSSSLLWLQRSCEAAALPGANTPSRGQLHTHAAPWTQARGASRRLFTDLAVQNVFMHVPHVSCQSEGLATLLANTTPVCCTITAADCAARCDALYAVQHGFGQNDRVQPVPTCLAFKFAVSDPAPPLAGYSQCVLLTTFSTCQVAVVPDVLNAVVQPLNPGGLVFDYYFRTYVTPTALPNKRYAQLNITGMPPSDVSVPAQLTNNCLNIRCDHAILLGFALQLALSQRCCATSVQTTLVPAGAGGGATTSTWMVAIWPAWVTDTSQFLATRLDAVLADAAGAAALLAAIQATFATVTAVSYQALNTTNLVAAASAGGVCNGTADSASAADVQHWRSAAIGLAAALAAMVALFLAHVARLLPLGQTPAGRRGGGMADKGGAMDVFLSYRRHDVALADAVFDQLALAGLRVFFDRAGDMAGRPFEEALYKALRDAAVTSVVVTLEGLRPCVHVHDSRPDFWLAEVLLALHFTRQRPGHHIYLLLFGVPIPGGSGERRYLLSDPGFLALVDALPNIVPNTTLALVSRMLASDAGGVLDPALQSITIRQLLLGRPASDGITPPFRGLLALGAVPIHGPEDHMGLLLRHRYAVQVQQAVRAAQSRDVQEGGKGTTPAASAELSDRCAGPAAEAAV